ncbi:hypothetical protein WBG78_10190 [Chryseolinea sp. T2]|uniref:hypothetical protein n=1 Tax=Chryseolinea sp. T2 TaxID=3129255 RepID=UPI003077798E
MKLIGMIMSFMVATAPLYAQSYTEKISKTLKFEKASESNAVIIANINGNVRVEGYEGSEIRVEVEKTVTAKTTERLEKGKQQIQLGVIDLADTVVLYVEGAAVTFGRKNSKSNNHYKGNFGYDWCCGNCNNGCNCRLDFDYKMDFVVKVPYNVHVEAGTVNNGNISVSKTRGVVRADNVNGSIKLTDLMRESSASTINGDVDIEYTSNPKKDCRFYSLNGDINAWFQKGLAANMSFESFNGDFYTNVTNLENLPTAIEKESTSKGLKYKVNGNRYRIGSGGAAMLDFETFNGNVYLKERTNQ